MDDIKTQAAALISQAPVAEDVKQMLMQKLEKEGFSDDLMVEIKVAVGQAQAKLNRDNKAQLDQLKELDKQEQEELAKAYSEFQKEMDELEEDADNLNKAVGDALQQQEMDDQRKKIASS